MTGHASSPSARFHILHHPDRSGLPGQDRLWLRVAHPSAVLRRALDHTDRKSTRLNSSHTVISYAVFCLKKKQIPTGRPTPKARIEAVENRLARASHLRVMRCT